MIISHATVIWQTDPQLPQSMLPAPSSWTCFGLRPPPPTGPGISRQTLHKNSSDTASIPSGSRLRHTMSLYQCDCAKHSVWAKGASVMALCVDSLAVCIFSHRIYTNLRRLTPPLHHIPSCLRPSCHCVRHGSTYSRSPISYREQTACRTRVDVSNPIASRTRPDTPDTRQSRPLTRPTSMSASRPLRPPASASSSLDLGHALPRRDLLLCENLLARLGNLLGHRLEGGQGGAVDYYALGWEGD